MKLYLSIIFAILQIKLQTTSLKVKVDLRLFLMGFTQVLLVGGVSHLVSSNHIVSVSFIQERFQVKNPPHTYIQKLRGFLDPAVTRKVRWVVECIDDVQQL